MNLKRPFRFPGSIAALVACGWLLLTGCQTPDNAYTGATPNNANIATGGSGVSADVLQVGETIKLEFSDIINPPGPSEQNIRDDGTITLPFNLTVKAAGKKKGELLQDIQDALVPKYYRRITVNLQAQDRFYFVGGEVKQPSRQIYVGEMTVLKAIQTAGDFTDFAKKRQVELTRASGEKITVDAVKAQSNPRLDPPVYPGDKVYVPRRYI